MKKLIVFISILLIAVCLSVNMANMASFDSGPLRAAVIITLSIVFLIKAYQANRITGIFRMEPSAIKADYLQGLVTSFDLNIRRVLPTIYDRFGNQGRDLLDLIRAVGFERTDSVTTVEHFEENWVHDYWKTSTVQTGAAAGAPVNLTVHPESIDSNNRFYPRINDVVTFNKNQVTAQIRNIDITTPSAPVLTVVPFDVTKAIPTTANGTTIIITGNAFSEGSTQPVGRFSGAWRYYNQFQIVKESVGASGTQMTNDSWVQIKDGQKILGWFNKARQWDLDHRMAINVQGTFLTQEITTNSAVYDTLNSNAPIQTTEGMFPYLKRVAIPYPYTPNSLTVADFDQQERLLSRVFAPRFTAALVAQDVDIELENILKDYFMFTQVGYTNETVNNKFFGDNPEGKALAATVAFRSFGKAGRHYSMKRLESMNDPKTYGATGYDYSARAIYFPLQKKKDPVSKNDIPTVGVVWKGLGSYNRKMEIFDLGGAGEGMKQTPVDRRDYYMRCEMSTEFFGGAQMLDMFGQ